MSGAALFLRSAAGQERGKGLLRGPIAGFGGVLAGENPTIWEPAGAPRGQFDDDEGVARTSRGIEAAKNWC